MQPKFTAEDTTIKKLGKATIKSPANVSYGIPINEHILYHPYFPGINADRPIAFEISQPEEYIYFDPTKVTAGIVTCGGLCPGLNNVIRAVVLGLYHGYGVRSIFGIRYGLQVFIP